MRELREAISKVASFYENGELLADTQPVEFFNLIYNDLMWKKELIQQLKELVKFAEANK